jgi:hypothetical protein
MNTQRQMKINLLIGICLCAICALFPPRKFTDPSDYRFIERAGKISPENNISHAFLFSEDFGIYSSSSPTATNRNGDLLYYPVEVDAGQLLAELALIVSLTGILILVSSSRVETVSTPDSKVIRAGLVGALLIAIMLAWFFVQ